MLTGRRQQEDTYRPAKDLDLVLPGCDDGFGNGTAKMTGTSSNGDNNHFDRGY